VKTRKSKIRLLVGVATTLLFYSTLTVADTQSTQGYRLAYSCVPQKVWDTGYHLKIVYDTGQRQYLALIYEASFLGESLLFTEPVNLTPMNQNLPGACIFKFRQASPNDSHLVGFTDIAHKFFKMKLILNGVRADAPLETLNCELETWFTRGFPGCF
jgi:hypothetical protein